MTAVAAKCPDCWWADVVTEERPEPVSVLLIQPCPAHGPPWSRADVPDFLAWLRPVVRFEYGAVVLDEGRKPPREWLESPEGRAAQSDAAGMP